MINVHASLLPRYRGAAPVHRAVIDGDTETGVTIMRVVPRLDAGADVREGQPRRSAPNETSDAVEARPRRTLGARLLLEVVDRLARIGDGDGKPQDDTLATYAPKLTKAEGAHGLVAAGAALHNRVRGLHPWPHASRLLEGARLIVLESRPAARDPRRAPWNDRARRPRRSARRRGRAAPRWRCCGCSPKDAGRWRSASSGRPRRLPRRIASRPHDCSGARRAPYRALFGHRGSRAGPPTARWPQSRQRAARPARPRAGRRHRARARCGGSAPWTI